jgi:HipA-like protein
MYRSANKLTSIARSNSKKPIKVFADFQQNWETLIPTLHKYHLDQVHFLSIQGDAPKDFVTDSEYRRGHRSRRERSESYIAKVGSKFYPNESITEHLITRIGQAFGLKVADSKLRIVDGQVRFMSKYFLNRNSEQLTHGAELFELILGKDDYARLAEERRESEYFTFQMTEEAVKESFPAHAERIMRGFVEMLTFDALIGHNDRHPYNWGVIVPLLKDRAPRFSPVFDTARALFWNKPERSVKQMLTDEVQFHTYIRGCAPPIGWDSVSAVDFCHLIGLIWNHYERYRRSIEKFLSQRPLIESIVILDKEFGLLMSSERRELIKRCLIYRYHLLCRCVGDFNEKEGKADAVQKSD